MGGFGTVKATFILIKQAKIKHNIKENIWAHDENKDSPNIIEDENTNTSTVMVHIRTISDIHYMETTIQNGNDWSGQLV
ncbi:hypothetical protein A3Q56_02469 [Intoshia linei]|uniref:Uncharacterized protein n=1 Tax=Intoshia linei TaxID=1819745 RepID=A0A177B6L9_9BILA|nr:hypothetical protein A3Q56_02469 [Intoshia linei]